MKHQPLRLIDSEEPTRQMMALAEIDQENREARWVPISEPQQNPALLVDDVLQQSLYALRVDVKVGWWRRAWRWVRRSF